MINKLAPKEILFNLDLKRESEDLEFKNIREIYESYNKICKIIDIKKNGYNLYLVDTYSKTRIESIKQMVEEVYKKRKAPRDICLCTLGNIQRPVSIIVSNGNGHILKECIDSLKNTYYKVFCDFLSKSYDESEKDKIIQEIEEKREEYIDRLINISKNEGFEVKASSEGFAFVPIINDKEMTEDEYDDLSENEKNEITENAINLRKKVKDTLEEIRNIEDEYNIKLREILAEYLDIKMQQEKENLFIQFIQNNQAVIYIEQLCQKIEEDIVKNYNSNEQYESEKEINDILNKYSISVLVDNKENLHPAIIYEDEPTINNLFGSIEYENDNGSYIAELSSIYPGSMLKANDGLIIIRLNSLIENPLCYSLLKKSLIRGNVNIDSNKNYLDIFSINGLKIENIPINTKVILIGSLENYNVLYNLDEDFRNLFQMKIEYPKEVNRNTVVESFIKSYILSKNSEISSNESSDYKVSDAAIYEIIKYLSRITENRDKINVELDKIDKIILLLNQEAKIKNKKVITQKDINRIIYDDDLYSDKILEYYKMNKVLISFTGKKVGCVNGLAVVTTGYFSCGKVIRITGVCYKGTGKIIDTQKESNMSGKIHEKSLAILSGILANVSDKYKKIEVDFHLSFEQVYGEIDGDSASVAEMICILSALSNIPVKQYIGVTGSLNQFGDVQPIGGVNEKIEGFYKMAEINGVQRTAVLIPSSNKNEIVLKNEVEEAVKKGKFNVYTMDTLDDAIELMLLDKGMSVKEFWNIVSKEIDKYC